MAIPRSLNLGWNFLSSGFVLNLFHICFLGLLEFEVRRVSGGLRLQDEVFVALLESSH